MLYAYLFWEQIRMDDRTKSPESNCNQDQCPAPCTDMLAERMEMPAMFSKLLDILLLSLYYRQLENWDKNALIICCCSIIKWNNNQFSTLFVYSLFAFQHYNKKIVVTMSMKNLIFIMEKLSVEHGKMVAN